MHHHHSLISKIKENLISLMIRVINKLYNHSLVIYLQSYNKIKSQNMTLNHLKVRPVIRYLNIPISVACSILRSRIAWFKEINFGWENTKSEKRLEKDNTEKFSLQEMCLRLKMILIKELLLRCLKVKVLKMKKTLIKIMNLISLIDCIICKRLIKLSVKGYQ